MKRILIIPDVTNLSEYEKLASVYNLGYEYNDFYKTSILDDEKKLKNILDTYKSGKQPSYCTLHGAFFDVIPFSMDEKIREISILRIHQSIDSARKVGAKAVIFHTNYNPFLNSEEYIDGWIENNARFWSEVLRDNPDINIYLENMFDLTSDILEELASRLCEYDNFGICLDYAHSALSKEKPEQWARKLGKYVKHIHINDNDLVRDLHLPWGAGKIDRQSFYECYEKYMSQASVLVETSSLQDIKQSLEMLEAEGFLTKENGR